MALEKYIYGKHDDAHHDGYASNLRRLQASENELEEWQDTLPSEAIIFTNRDRHIENRKILHGSFYKGRYYHHGVAQPHAKKS